MMLLSTVALLLVANVSAGNQSIEKLKLAAKRRVIGKKLASMERGRAAALDRMSSQKGRFSCFFLL